MKLKILGHDYTVSHEEHLSRDRNSNAFFCGNSLEIKIDPSLPESRRKEALMHEIIEALNFHLELRLEHSQITALGEGIYAVLNRNGMLNEGALLVKE